MCKKNEKDTELYSVGPMMVKDHPKEIDIDKILNLPYSELTILRRNVFERIISDSEKHENSIIDTHAVFRWYWGLFPAFDLDQVMKYGPDMFITLIDDIDEVRDRLLEKLWTDHSLKDIAVWREEEILVTGVLAHALGYKPHYIVSRGHGPETVYKLMFREDLKRVYISFPISGIPDEERKEIEKYRKEVRRVFVGFDPLKIAERDLILERNVARRDIKEYFKKHQDLIGAYIKKINDAVRRWEKRSKEKKNWDFLRSPDQAVSAISDSVRITIAREACKESNGGTEESPRLFFLGELNSVEKDIDGQIISRDYMLIDQSEIVLIYIPIVKFPDGGKRPLVSAGCQTELVHAYSTDKEIYIFFPGEPEDLSPWITGFKPNRIFRSLKEGLEYFRKKGYIE